MALRPFLVLVFALGLLSTPSPAADSAFRLYVSNERSGDISVIDGETLAVIQTIPVGKRPRGVHVSPDGRTLYVATSGSPRMGPGTDPERAKDLKADKSADGIAIVDLAAGRVVRRLHVGSDPEEFALTRDGSAVIVANEDVATITIWEIASGKKLSTTAVSEEPEGVTVHPTRDEAWVTCEEEGDIVALDTRDGRERWRLRLGGRPRTITFTRDGSRAYVPLEAGAAIAVIDANADHGKLLGKIALPAPALPMGAVLSPDERELFVTTGRGNHVAVIDATTQQVVANIAVGSRPWGIARSPDGRLLFTANGASDDISVVDSTTRRELRRIKTAAGPWGIALAPPPNSSSTTLQPSPAK